MNASDAPMDIPAIRELEADILLTISRSLDRHWMFNELDDEDFYYYRPVAKALREQIGGLLDPELQMALERFERSAPAWWTHPGVPDAEYAPKKAAEYLKELTQKRYALSHAIELINQHRR